MKRICVFCGSKSGSRPEYLEAADRLGRLLVKYNLGLVYGGTNVGTMGALADSALAAGGEVIGVVPEGYFDMEVAHESLAELRIADSLSERKRVMADLSDAFIAMPGGLGTIDEFFEMLTWSQFGLHQKPTGLLNVCNYFQSLMIFLDHAVAEGFLTERYRQMILVADEPEEMLEAVVNVEW